MLSAIPSVSPQTEFFSQSIAFQFAPGALNSANLYAAPNQTIRFATGSGLLGDGFIVFDAVQASGSVVNMYGLESATYRELVVPAAEAELFDNREPNQGYMPWEGAPAPVLDPIVGLPYDLPTFSPIKWEPVFAPVAFGGPTSSPIAVPAPSQPFSSIAALATNSSLASTIAVANTRDDPSDGASPRWLSATFSVAEQHLLDTSMADVRDSAVTARDSQTRFPLEPTRVSSQAFCVAASGSLPAGSDGIERPSASLREKSDHQTSGKQFPAQPRSDAGADPSVGSNRPLVNDAAILGWELPRSLHESARSDTDVVMREEPPLGVGRYSTGDASQPWRIAAQFLDEKKHVVGAALAVIAVKSLVERGSDKAEEAEWPRQPVKLLRKTRAPIR